MRATCTLVVAAGLLGGGISAPVRILAADAAPEHWRDVLALPPENAQPMAVLRWQPALEIMADLTALEQAVLGELPDEPPKDQVLTQLRTLVRKRSFALNAFGLRPGESARVPAGMGLGRGLASPMEWRALARLKELQVRLSWWAGDQDKAVTAAADLIRAGSAAARDATELQGWVIWQTVAEQGYEAALWIARQVDVTDEELASLSAALHEAGGSWPDGAANALRGEYAFGFRGAVDHLPDTLEIAAMLDALADFGTPATPEGAAEILGIAERPLFDRAATLDLYGEMAATFITTIQRHPTWRQELFAADFERRTETWLAELGVFGELAHNRQIGEYPPDQLPALRAALTQAENPVGKLLVVLGAPNLDSLAFTGIRSEAQRRCTRALVEWRRCLGRGADLPTTLEAWAGIDVSAGELEDPFTGQPLFFNAEKLRIWSVGLDGTNNQGTGDPRQDLDGSDFWWSLEAE